MTFDLSCNRAGGVTLFVVLLYSVFSLSYSYQHYQCLFYDSEIVYTDTSSKKYELYGDVP
jgi:uncharacterized membrane protein